MLRTIIVLMLGWGEAFAQQRTRDRAIRQALSSVCVLGRRTIARSYLVREAAGDWSSEYKLHSRSPWQAQSLFEPILKEAIEMCRGKLLPMGADDTRLRKSGKKVKTAHWGRDPRSPAFRVNLQYGLRFLHASVLIPLHQQHYVSARALPVYFGEAWPVPKPGKRAGEQEQKAYRRAVKEHNLSTQALAMLREIRLRVDDLGGRDKRLAFAVDGSFCNKTLFCADLERTILIARARKDAKLCWPAVEGRRKYGAETFTPESVLHNKEYGWQTATIFHGGKRRYVDYKEVNQLLWRRGAKTKPLRLLVVRPIPYRKTKKGRLLYRKPAFLLTAEFETPAQDLMQIYFDRWQLEVAHQELKDSFGLGQAQVRVPASVARQPALTAATYSTLHLAALKCFGAYRTEEFGSMPKYQRDKVRPSSRDLIRFLRYEVVEQPHLLFPFDFKISEKSMLAAAAL